MQGKVKWFNNQKGYGFIQYEEAGEEKEIFVHFTGIEMDGYKSLSENQAVSFEIVEGARGPQASQVVPGEVLENTDQETDEESDVEF